MTTPTQTPIQGLTDEVFACTKCKREYPRAGFGTRSSGTRDSRCKLCISEYMRNRIKSLPPEYLVWESMKARCSYKGHKYYPSYGGRGITYCAEWKSFDSFINDMGRRPSNKHQIDRIDNNCGYSKANCRWATAAENSRNRRNTVLTMEKADSIREMKATQGLSTSAIAKIIGVSYSAVSGVVCGRTWRHEVAS